MPNPFCVAPGCARRSTSDSRFCAEHVARPPIAPEPPTDPRQLVAHVIERSGASASLDGELRVLRAALAQVVTDVDDPVVAAGLIAKLCGAVATIARTQRAITGDAADSLQDAFTQILIELGQP